MFVGPKGGKLLQVGSAGTEPNLRQTEQAIDAVVAQS